MKKKIIQNILNNERSQLNNMQILSFNIGRKRVPPFHPASPSQPMFREGIRTIN